MFRHAILGFCTVLALSACDDQSAREDVANYAGSMGGGRAAKMMAASPQSAPAPMMAEASMAQDAAPPSSMVLDREAMGDRRIAETHNLSIETTFDALEARYQRDFKKCVELGCQIINSSVQREQNGYLQARIAPSKLGEFLDSLAQGPGKIENHGVSADDYTMEYSDTAAQTENLMALRDRLRTLLNSPRADSVQDILNIERELNRVQTQIDQRTARLKILQTMTQMATVNLSYSVQYRPTEIKPYELKNTWKYAVQKFLMAIDRMIQFVAAALPWLPVLVGGVWLGVWTLRLAFRKLSIRMPWRKG